MGELSKQLDYKFMEIRYNIYIKQVAIGIVNRGIYKIYKGGTNAVLESSRLQSCVLAQSR